MRSFDLSKPAYSRRAADGSVWLHFPCPLCAATGLGPDPSAHLGFIVPGEGAVRKIRLNCWRCGAHGSPLKYQLKLIGADDWPTVTLPANHAAVRSPLPTRPFYWPPAKDDAYGASVGAAIRTLRLWPGLALEEIAARGATLSPETPYTLHLPYVTTDGKLSGVMQRSLYGSPKIRTFGPIGPCCQPGMLPSPDSEVVIVEGWMDAVAVPYPYVPLILQGTGHAKAALRGLPCKAVTLLLDGDGPGRKAARYIARNALLEGKPCRYARLPVGQDPAEAGTAVCRAALTDAKGISVLSDLTFSESAP